MPRPKSNRYPVLVKMPAELIEWLTAEAHRRGIDRMALIVELIERGRGEGQMAEPTRPRPTRPSFSLEPTLPPVADQALRATFSLEPRPTPDKPGGRPNRR